MLRKIFLVLLAASACRAQGVADQAPVYKLLYSPPLGSELGGLWGIAEARPGLFYILSTWSTTNSGSIFTVTSAGGFRMIYAFPQYTTMVDFVQATNGKVYGSGFTNTPPYPIFYYSIDLSGKHLQEYPFPTPWGPGWNTTVAPPNELYDLVAQTVSGQTVWAFARGLGIRPYYHPASIFQQ